MLASNQAADKHHDQTVSLVNIVINSVSMYDYACLVLLTVNEPVLCMNSNICHVAKLHIGLDIKINHQHLCILMKVHGREILLIVVRHFLMHFICEQIYEDKNEMFPHYIVHIVQ